jgi:hypothetical protein
MFFANSVSSSDQDVPRWVERAADAGWHHHSHHLTGHTYTTEAHGAALFPTLAQSTGELDIAPHLDAPQTDKSVMMPRRKHTREHHRRERIKAERRERTELIAEEERQRQAWLAQNYEPPPF